jgi:multidrug efflux pump subunit AcrA (membrane-fusion protein)
MSEKQHSAQSLLDMHALDAVLDAFVRAAQDPSVTREDLYGQYHSRLVAATHSLASAVFSKRPDSQFTMVGQAGWKQFDSATLIEIKDAIKHQYQSDQSQPKPNARLSTFVGRTKPIDGVEFLVVLVRKKDPDPLVEQLLADLIKEIALQVENHELRRAAEHRPRIFQDLTQLVQLTQNVAKAQSLTELAMHLVNDLAKVARGDRVCFFNSQGKLLAVSGVSQVALKTGLARNLSRLARAAISNRIVIESAEDQVGLEKMDEQFSIQQWLAELDSEGIYIKPIEHDQRCYGAVSVEFFQSGQFLQGWVEQRSLISQSIDFLTPIVSRAVQVNTIPGIRLLDFVFNKAFTKPLRIAFWSSLLMTILLGGIYLLFFVERAFEIHAEGVLQPRNTRHVFAPHEGEIKSLFVSDASPVEAGQPLITIESKRLTDLQLVTEGELAEVSQELQNVMIEDLQQDRRDVDDQTGVDLQTQVAADVQRLKLKQETLKERLKRLEVQLKDLQLVAPIRGQVTTPHLSQRLTGRPVNRGDLLMSVSEMDGEWEIELTIPDNRLKFIQSTESPRLRFRIASNSDRVFDGQIREYDFRAQASTDALPNPVRVLVDFAETDLPGPARLGARVVAKIDCGARNNWFLLTYELKDKLKQWFFW